MSNSSLVTTTIKSPNMNAPRNHVIDKITIHHMAGFASAADCGASFANPAREASSNYGIDNNGNVGLYVDECNRAWTSGSRENDNRAVTIEVANCKGEPNWEVSDVAYNKLIDLCVDICKRNNIKSLNWTGDANGNLTCHYMFAQTACPGPYLKSKMPEIAAAVNAKLSGSAAGPSNVTPFTPATGKVKVHVTYQSMVNGRWLGEIVDFNNVNEIGYSGIYGQPIQNFAVKVSKGSLWYQAHVKGGGWLGKITQFNLNDFINGYAGNNQPIDAIMCYYISDYDVVQHGGYQKIHYRVHTAQSGWLPWVADNEDYAGIMGQTIDGIQMYID